MITVVLNIVLHDKTILELKMHFAKDLEVQEAKFIPNRMGSVKVCTLNRFFHFKNRSARA